MEMAGTGAIGIIDLLLQEYGLRVEKYVRTTERIRKNM
jgi:hypothetical protein